MTTRVLHSSPIWLPLTQSWLYNQVRFTPPARVEAHVVCERTSHLDLFDVPNLHSLESCNRVLSTVDRLARKLRLRRHLGHQVRVGRRVGAELLHSHFGHVAWADAPVARRLAVPHVVTYYGLDVNMLPFVEPRWRDRYADLFTTVARVLCEGPYMARCVVALGCPPERVHVHRLGVELDRLAYRPRCWDGSGPLRVLMAGSFREKKGLPDALEALARLREHFPVQATLVGDAGDDPESRREKARIIAVVERRRLHGVVRMTGYLPPADLHREAYAHHVFLSPSRVASNGDTEGGAPVTLTEMAATGMPIVATLHCDIPDVVEHGRGGLLAPEGDVEGIAAHLARLADDPGAWRRMTDAARQRIELEFDAVAQGSRLADHYEELLR